MRIATVVLPVPGLPVKLMCRLAAGLRRPQAEVQAQLVDHQQRRDVADALLDRRQADQVAVEFVHHRLDLALRQHLGDGARRARRSAVAAAAAGVGRAPACCPGWRTAAWPCVLPRLQRAGAASSRAHRVDHRR